MAYSLSERSSHLGESPREKTQREAREKQQAAQAAKNASPAAPQPQADTSADQKTKAKGSLRYPEDIGTDASSHYAIFEFYDYLPPFSLEGSGGDKKTLSAYNTSTNSAKKAAYPQIILYMPEGIAAAYAADWDGKAFGNIAAAGLKSAGAAAGGDYQKMISKLTSELGNQFNTSLSTLGSQLTSALAKRITGDSIGVQDVFSSIGGAILNPNVELIFGGHQLRTLQLNFKMVPYNLTEAKNVHEIVQTFKKVMLPKFNGATNMSNFWSTGTESGDKNKSNNGFIGNPNLCKITFMQGPSKNKYITQFKTCAITDFQVNYTPDGVAAFGPDGYPVATQISLSFMETKLVYAEEVNDGY